MTVASDFVAALVGLRPPDAATKSQRPAFSKPRQESTQNPRGAVQTTEAGSLSAKALKKIGSHFPILEPSESIAQHIELGPGGAVKQKELRRKQWNFFGKEREKQLTIEPGAVYVRYTKYSRFEDLKDEFQEAVNALDQEASGIVAQRFGLRYINQFHF